jgi:hypothetical protein
MWTKEESRYAYVGDEPGQARLVRSNSTIYIVRGRSVWFYYCGMKSPGTKCPNVKIAVVTSADLARLADFEKIIK